MIVIIFISNTEESILISFSKLWQKSHGVVFSYALTNIKFTILYNSSFCPRLRLRGVSDLGPAGNEKSVSNIRNNGIKITRYITCVLIE